MQNLFYRELGVSHKNAGFPTLIILHGLFGSCDNWLTISKKIAEKYHVLLLDQRNHGRSPHYSDHNYQVLSRDLKTFIEQQNLNQNPALIGHSMGGKTVLFYAQNYPKSFDRLLIADIGIKHYPVHHQFILDGLNAIDLTSLESRKQANTLLSEYVSEQGVRQFLLKNLYRNQANQFVWRINLPVLTNQIQHVGQQLDIPNPIKCKILFLRGGQSNYILDTDISQIKTAFPTAKIVTLRGAGHWLHAEKPNEFLSTVIEFMKS